MKQGNAAKSAVPVPVRVYTLCAPLGLKLTSGSRLCVEAGPASAGKLHELQCLSELAEHCSYKAKF